MIALDVSSTAELDSQIRSYDLVISLVPYMYHVAIITAAIKHKVNVVTTSYISDAMRELDAPAREAGIAVLNEVGVDPGVSKQSEALRPGVLLLYHGTKDLSPCDKSSMFKTCSDLTNLKLFFHFRVRALILLTTRSLVRHQDDR